MINYKSNVKQADFPGFYHQSYFDGYNPQALSLAKTTSHEPPSFAEAAHVAESGWYVSMPTQKWTAPASSANKFNGSHQRTLARLFR